MFMLCRSPYILLFSRYIGSPSRQAPVMATPSGSPASIVDLISSFRILSTLAPWLSTLNLFHLDLASRSAYSYILASPVHLPSLNVSYDRVRVMAADVPYARHLMSSRLIDSNAIRLELYPASNAASTFVRNVASVSEQHYPLLTQ